MTDFSFKHDVLGILGIFREIRSEKKPLSKNQIHEIDMLCRLHHPNIFHAINFKYEKDSIQLEIPFADRTLDSYIASRRYFSEQKLQILSKLMIGIDYLHRNNIVLTCLEPRYIYLSGRDEVRIGQPERFIQCDETGMIEIEQLELQPEYVAPELLLGEKYYSTKCDIWSLGILMLVLFSERYVYRRECSNDLNLLVKSIKKAFGNEEARIETCKYFLRPVSDKNRKSNLVTILNRILVLDPNKRINSESLLEYFNITPVENNKHEQYSIPTNLDKDHREYLKILSYVFKAMVPEVSVEVLFLAIEIHFRVGEAKTNSIVAIVMIVLAYFSLEFSLEKLKKTLEEHDKLSEFHLDAAYKAQIDIIAQLKGVINLNRIYHSCESNDELISTYFDVIMSKTPGTYAKYQFKKAKGKKNLTIEELFEES